MKAKKLKKIAICHYRVGETDGVSLEIKKRKCILEKHNCEVKLIAGPRSKGADYVIKELEWDNGVIPIIKENGFIYFKRDDLSPLELKQKMNKISFAVLDRLNFIQLQENFDFVLIHNIFSFGGHIAVAKAFAMWIKKFKIPTLATHHDFYWERKEFQTPRNLYLKHYMEKFMPPKSKYIQHVVINSLAKKELKKRSDIDSDIVNDVFDFNQKEWKQDNFNKDFLKEFNINSNDIIILQATRVIPRKGIEIAIDYAKDMQKKIKKLHNTIIYNGKKISKKSNVVLIVAGYAEDEKRDYLFKLKTKAFNDQIHVKFISNHVRSSRAFKQGIKYYSLWDAYVFADIITFPSIWEGWGNQFIEAIFAKKPIVLYEYPVYKVDIKKENYNIISLGNETLKQNENKLFSISQKNIKNATKKTIKWLKNKELNKILDKNFLIGKKYHDYKILEEYLIKKINLK